MRNDLQRAAGIIKELNVAEIRPLQLHGGIEYLVEHRRQIGGRSKPCAQLVQPAHRRELVPVKPGRLPVAGEPIRALSMTVAHGGLANGKREPRPRRDYAPAPPSSIEHMAAPVCYVRS